MNLADLILQYLEFQGNKPNVMVNVSDDECEDDLDRSKLRQVFLLLSEKILIISIFREEALLPSTFLMSCSEPTEK